MTHLASTSVTIRYRSVKVVNTAVAPVETFAPTGFYKSIMLLLLAGAGFLCYRIGKYNFLNPIPLQHPLTLQLIMGELFIFVAVIILTQISRKITIDSGSAISSDCFGRCVFRVDEVKGCIAASGESTPAYYLLNRENKILWSFAKPAGMQVFEREEKLMQWIRSFELLNASGPWPAFQMKFSRLYVAGLLLLCTLPFQFIGLEIWLSMLSAK